MMTSRKRPRSPTAGVVSEDKDEHTTHFDTRVAESGVSYLAIRGITRGPLRHLSARNSNKACQLFSSRLYILDSRAAVLAERTNNTRCTSNGMSSAAAIDATKTGGVSTDLRFGRFTAVIMGNVDENMWSDRQNKKHIKTVYVS